MDSRSATVAALLSIRLGGLMLTAPVLSPRALPGHLKTAIVALLVVLLWPAAEAGAPEGVRFAAGAVMGEAVVGVVLGLGAALFVTAAEAAGDTVAVQMGLSGANVLDPLSGTQVPVVGQLLGLFVTTLLVALGGHLVMLEALGSSLAAVPVGGGVESAGHLAGVATLGGTLFVLGLRFAAPVVAAMMVGNAALGVLARAVPQLNVLMVAFPLQIGLGLFVLSVTLPLTATYFAGWDATYTGLVSSLLEGLAPAGRP